MVSEIKCNLSKSSDAISLWPDAINGFLGREVRALWWAQKRAGAQLLRQSPVFSILTHTGVGSAMNQRERQPLQHLCLADTRPLNTSGRCPRPSISITEQESAGLPFEQPN